MTAIVRFNLAQPVTALKYVRGDNDQEIAGLIRGVYNKISFSNSEGPLHFYNDGPEFWLNDGDWAVLFADTVATMSDSTFLKSFVPE